MSGLEPGYRALLPTEAQTLFLRAALTDAPAEPFSALLDRLRGDFVAFLNGEGREMRGQLSLLYENLRVHEVPYPEGLGPYLRTATLRAKLRLRQYEAGARAALEILTGADIPFVAVKGVAAAYTAYSDPQLRHCHDVDLVANRSDLPALRDALAGADFSLVRTDPLVARLDHDGGLPIMLHARPVAQVDWMSADWLLDGRRIVETPIGVLPVPEPGRAAIHAMLHGLSAGRRAHCNWVADSLRWIRQGSDVDRETLEQAASDPETQAMIRTAVAYLNDGFATALDLSRHARTAPTDAIRMGLLEAAQRGEPDRTGRVLHALDGEERRRLKWLGLFPPAAHFNLRASRQPGLLWVRRAKRLVKIGAWSIVNAVRG